MTGVETTVRRADSVDWQALKTIRLESLFDTPEAYGSTFADSSTWPDARWRQVTHEWTFFLAERDDQVIGLASGGFNDQRPGTAWMYGMYVTPGARGTGVAELLVGAVGMWALAQGFNQLYLHVTTSVTRARAFYEKVGFRWTGDTISMDRDPSISLVTMVRELD